MTEQKYCKDCKWHGYSVNYCKNPNNGASPVDGAAKVRLSEVNRSGHYFGQPTCGEKGKWWESKVGVVQAANEPKTYWQKLKTYFS